MFRKLWNDDAGVIALEYLLLSVIVGLGMVVGYSNVSIALNVEYTELASAITALDDGYYVTTQAGGGANSIFTSGKMGTDVRDTAGSLFWARCTTAQFCPTPVTVFAGP